MTTQEARSLLRRASPLIIGRGLSAVLTFAIPVVLARRLEPHAYGTYKQFFLVAATCTLMGQVGIPASLYYFLPRARGERGRYLVQALAGLLLLGSLAAIAVAATAGELAYRFDNPDYAALAPPLALYVAASMGALPLEIALTATGRTGWAAVTYVLSDLARTTALVAPILAGAGLPGLAWAAVVFAGLRLLAAWAVALTRSGGELRAPSRASIVAQVRYSLPLGAAVVLAVAHTQLPMYVVAALTDGATFALFTVGVLQLPLTEMIYASMVEVMMVRLGEPGARAVAIFREAVGRLALFFLPLAALMWAVAPELIPALYTPTYARAAPIFMIASAEIVLSTLPVDGLLRAMNATRVIFKVNALRLVTTAVAVPSCLILFGLPGAMAAYVLTQLLGKALLLGAASAGLGVPVKELLPGRALLAWAGRGVAVYAGVAALRVYGPWDGWSFLAAAAPLAGGIWLLSLITAGELRRQPAVAAEAAAP